MRRQSVFFAKVLGCLFSLIGCFSLSANANVCSLDSPGSCATSSVRGLDANNTSISSTVINPDSVTLLGSSTASSAGGGGGMSGTAGAFADFGVLKATAFSQSSSPVGTQGFISANAGAEFLDTGTVFSNVFQGTVSIPVTYQITGTFSGNGGIGPDGVEFVVGNNILSAGITNVTFTVGQTVNFLAYINVFADATSVSGGTPTSAADFGHSVHIFFDAPEGYTFVAGSGHDYSSTAATPVDGVPEPSTWAMMLLGFCGLGFMAHRRRNSAMVAA